MRSFSYSDYSVAVQCLRKYQLAIVDKIHVDEAQSGDMAFGSALHAALSSAVNNEDPIAVFTIYWDSEKNKELAYTRFNWEQLKELGLMFLTKFDKRYKSTFVPQVTEKRLYAEYKNIKLEGTPDFIGTYEGVPALFDWKTAAYSYDKAKADIALQLNLYAYLAIKELNFTPKVLGYLVFNKGGGSIQNPLVWEFDEAKMYAMLDDFALYCGDLNDKKYFPKNPNACIIGTNKCQFFTQCWGKKGNQ